ncbi:MAG: hypothetical protein ACFB10_06740 [Salibacteraceae bacterium]
MSLSDDFLNNYGSFMKNHAILIPNQTTAGVGTFKFAAQGQHAVLLQNTGSINGIYVKPQPNHNNVYTLPAEQEAPYYMFTDQMTGCQWMAYGPSRHDLTVEHNNFINNPNQYAQRLQHIQAQNHAYCWHISAGVNNIAQGSYNAQDGLNILGEYTPTNGWRFFVRDRAGANQGELYGPF